MSSRFSGDSIPETFSHHVQSVIDNAARIEKSREYLSHLKNQSCVLLFGNTGAGKSTTANALVAKDHIEPVLDEDGDETGFLNVKVLLKDHTGAPVFEIGQGASSKTARPGIFKHQQAGLYFVDCPGFHDSDPTKELINRSEIQHIFNVTTRVQIVVIQDFSGLDANRGQNFIELCKGLSAMVNSLDSVHFLITKAEGKKPATVKRLMKNAINFARENAETEEKKPAAVKMLMKNEAKDLVAFIEAAITNFVFFSPTNVQDSGWGKRYCSIEGVQDMLTRKSDSVVSVSKDIPSAVEEYIQNRYFLKVYRENEFRSSINVREQVKLCLERICSEWDGPNARAMLERVSNEIDIQDAAGRNKNLKWFIHDFDLASFAEREKDIRGYRDPGKTPILYTLYKYFSETGKLNENDEYDGNDLDRILEILSEASGTREWRIKSMEGKDLTLKEVAKNIKDQKIDDEKDEVMREGWKKAIRLKIIDSLRIVCPSVYRWRFYNQTIRMGLSFRDALGI